MAHVHDTVRTTASFPGYAGGAISSGALAICIPAIIFVGLVVFLPDNYHLASRVLIGFDAGFALYLVLVTVMILRSDPDRVRRESPLQDDGRIAIPILTVAAGLVSLGAIVFWLRKLRRARPFSPACSLSYLSPHCSLGSSSTPCSLCITPMNITRSIAAKVAACAFPAAVNPAIGTLSISPL
jgi:Protein of unknown function (DUF1345)